MTFALAPAAAVLCAWVVAGAARRLEPDVAVRLLRRSALGSMAATAVALAAVVVAWLVSHPIVWMWSGLWQERHPTRTDAVVGGAAIAAGTLSAWRVSRWLARSISDARAVPAAAGQLVLVDAPEAEAFASPRHGGTIVVTTGLWAALADEERAAVVAHEAAHLRLRHPAALAIAEAVAAANPTLIPLRTAMRRAVERAADEAAATTVDRVTLARAVARAGLAQRSGRRVPAGVAAIDGGPTVERVRALLCEPAIGDRPTTALCRAATASAAVVALGEALLLAALLAHLF